MTILTCHQSPPSMLMVLVIASPLFLRNNVLAFSSVRYFSIESEHLVALGTPSRSVTAPPVYKPTVQNPLEERRMLQAHFPGTRPMFISCSPHFPSGEKCYEFTASSWTSSLTLLSLSSSSIRFMIRSSFPFSSGLGANSTQDRNFSIISSRLKGLCGSPLG